MIILKTYGEKHPFWKRYFASNAVMQVLVLGDKVEKYDDRGYALKAQFTAVDGGSVDWDHTRDQRDYTS